MKLHDFQQKAFTDVSTAFAEGHINVGLKMPCGSGKTWVGCEFIRHQLKYDHPCLFVVDRDELVKQTSEKLNLFRVEHSLITAGWKRYKSKSKVWVASVQTLAKQKIPKVDCVVIDEFHTVYKANNRWLDDPNVICLGLSATPFSAGLGNRWQKLVVGPTVQELTDWGFLVPSVVYHPFIIDVKDVDINAGQYNQTQLGQRVNQPQIVADIVKTWLRLGENRQTICFAVNTDHAKELAQSFRDSLIFAAVIDHHTEFEERKEILAGFATGLIRVVCNVDILTKGFDECSASCMIDAAPTMSLSRFHQRHGRVQRIYDGKTDALILDHAGNCQLRHGLPTDPTPNILTTSNRSVRNSPTTSKVRVCPKCDVVKQRHEGRQCGVCGYVLKDRTLDSGVVITEGVLISAEDEKQNKRQLEKREWYSMLLWWADYKNYKRGWASFTYKYKFGEFPPKDFTRQCKPIRPNMRVANYLHYRMKNSKRTMTEKNKSDKAKAVD